MEFERRYLNGGGWQHIDRALAETELGTYYANPAQIIRDLEASASATAPAPGSVIYTDIAAYRATATAPGGGNGHETEGKE